MDRYEILAKEWIYESETFDYDTALNTLSHLFKMVADSAAKEAVDAKKPEHLLK